MYLGQIIPIEYVPGLTHAELVELLIPGEDEEGTEELRAKYFNSLNSQAFGGNVTDYKEKVNKIPGVGGVKVYPVWAGGGTVKLVIINSEYNKPSAELVGTVQEFIDPPDTPGQGIGIAPIGHTVTVAGVAEQLIDITTDITYQSGWSWSDVQAYVNTKIDDYLLSLRKGWADTDNIVVRISQIETHLLSVPGILDIGNTAINGTEANFVVAADSIPVRGSVNG